MAINLQESDKGYAPTLKFKDLSKKDYLIVSKKFDEPRSGPSQFCKNTGGNWYLFGLTLHEFAQVNFDTLELEVTKDTGDVSYFDGDNEYEKDDGTWFQSQGTILKALNAAAVGEQIKITMEENDKGKKVYRTETVGQSSVSTPTPATSVGGKTAEVKPKPAPEEPETISSFLKQGKSAGVAKEELVKQAVEKFGVTAKFAENRYEVA